MNTSAAQRRTLAWKLNWYRQSELEGALLLGRMVRMAENTCLCARLTRHCADEARHSQLWAATIAELGLPHVRILRSYQSLYAGVGGPPKSLTEVLAFTQVFERRVHKQFLSELRHPDTPDTARKTFAIMIEDEKDHLGWVREWLDGRPETEPLLRRYHEIDLEVFQQVQPFADRLWEMPGLGVETSETVISRSVIRNGDRDPPVALPITDLLIADYSIEKV